MRSAHPTRPIHVGCAPRTANGYTRERSNIVLLAICQALFNITAITVMTLSGLVGRELAPDAALATLPVSAMILGTLTGTLPASLFMQRVGRRAGFLVGAAIGAAIGGVGGGAVSVLAGAVAYAVMIMVMTATPLAMRAAGFGMQDAAFIMQWHVLGMFAPSFVTGYLIARLGVDNILLGGGTLLVASARCAELFGHLPALPDLRAPAILINGMRVAPADGVIISPQDLGLVLDEFHPGAPRLEMILDEVLERCMQEWN